MNEQIYKWATYVPTGLNVFYSVLAKKKKLSAFDNMGHLKNLECLHNLNLCRSHLFDQM